MPPTSSKSMSDLGFAEYKSSSKPYMIISIAGLEKDGKTNFGFTAPGPIAYYPFDYGHEGVIDKFSKEKTIYVKQLKKPEVKGGNLAAVDPKSAEREWENFRTSVRAVGERKDIRTIVFDKGGDVWNLHRLAKFGKINQVTPLMHVEINNEHREWINSLYEYKKNVVFIHELKKQYVKLKGQDKDVWDGKYEVKGFSDIIYKVQVSLLAAYVDEHKDEDGETVEGHFRLTIDRTRIMPAGMSVRGYVFDASELCNFQSVAEMLVPETPWEDWL